MTGLTRPHGPLPPRVYWVRRMVVLGLAFVLVTSLAVTLRLASDGRGGGAVTPVAGAPATSEEPGSTAPATVTVTAEPTGAAAGTGNALAEPDGTCEAEEIVASPLVYRAFAGRRSLMVIELRTRERPACYWQVSSESLTLKITRPAVRDGQLPVDIWSTQRCPQAVPTRNLVVRRDVGVRFGVIWSGRRADAECSRATRWALPGWFQVEVAALAGEPRELQFELRRPEPVTVTRTRTPSPTPVPEEPTAEPTDQPTGSTSGAVEPAG